MIVSRVCVMCSRLMCPYLSSVLVILCSFLSSCVCLIIYDYTVYFIVLSVQFDLVWSTRYSPVFLSVSTSPRRVLPSLIWIH